ncbi:MAG: hypothetical protein HBSAPP04_25220 [Ignavibacteriaceae bacterium]|nr:MAG: DUF481 domain-containing protein [Chlorobiota bacterium]GJQ33683.1 MAG: hypothetical protein HBSAPP04_25220 [Ignavibacteriaceae bacterium]
MSKYFFTFLSLIIGSIYGQINIEELRLDDDTSGMWSGHIESELTYKKGNSDVLLLESTVAIEADWKNSSLLQVLKGDIGESNGIRISNEFVAHLRYVNRFSPDVYAEAFLQYNYNLSRKILNREIAGGGVRFLLVEEPAWKIRLGAGAMFEREEFDVPRSGAQSREMSLIRGNSYISVNYIPAKNITIASTTYFQPAFKAIENFRILSETKAAFKFSEDLSFTIKFNLFYDNIPLQDLKVYDIDSKYGVEWEF